MLRRWAFPDVERLAPNTVGVRHWSRLLGGLLYATSPRVEWSKLLRRMTREASRGKPLARVREAMLREDGVDDLGAACGVEEHHHPPPLREWFAALFTKHANI